MRSVLGKQAHRKLTWILRVFDAGTVEFLRLLSGVPGAVRPEQNHPFASARSKVKVAGVVTYHWCNHRCEGCFATVPIITNPA